MDGVSPKIRARRQFCTPPTWEILRAMAQDNLPKLIFGCGYLGQRVAARWRDSGHRVYAVTRCAAHAARFRLEGWEPIVADITQPTSLRDLPRVSTLLFAVGFDRSAGRTIHDVYVGGLAAVLDAARHRFNKLIYVSSTGVYGGVDGEWVDEDSPCVPAREGGQACLAAENLLRADEAHARAVILRLAGIYGPLRVPQRQALRLQNGSFSPGQLDRYLNLIHVDDAASCCIRADQVAATPSLFNVTDGHPILRRDYYSYLVARLGLSASLLDPSALSEVPSRVRADHKRVSNQRMLAELAMQLDYEDYRRGLDQALAHGESSDVNGM